MAVASAQAALFGIPTTLRIKCGQQHHFDHAYKSYKVYSWAGTRSSTHQAHLGGLKHEPRDRSPTGIPSAHTTDLKQSSVSFGPRGMLLIGFSREDGDTVAAWMHQMEPGFAVSNCTPDMLKGTVQDAVCHGDLDAFRIEPYTQVDEPLPRLVLLSGMSGEETIAIAEHWELFTGTAPPIMATLVDQLLHRQLQEAILDIVKSFSISNRRKDATEAAGLREMIKKKLEQRQAQAGRRLITRGDRSIIQIETPSPADLDRRGGNLASSMSSQTSNSNDAEREQKEDSAAQRQVEALKASLPKQAHPQKRAAAKKEQKVNREKRGFG